MVKRRNRKKRRRRTGPLFALLLAAAGVWLMGSALFAGGEMQPAGSALWDKLTGGGPALPWEGESKPPEESTLPVLPAVTLPPEQPEPAPTAPPAGGIIAKTMVAGSSAKYITEGVVSVYNHTEYRPDLAALLAAAPKLTLSEDGPTVLIFHSHATEAYTMAGADVYEESDSYRTLNTRQNMVRIGEEMKAVFEAAGIGVIHDTTLYDYPKYNEAYTRSAAAVEKWLEEYPSLQLVLDVHRDALAATDGTIYKTAAGTLADCAQVMMVMGSDAMGQEHPRWKTNLALALSFQNALAEKWFALARPLVLRPSRFNQQLSTGMILLEVGTHGNTLQEAITAARIFARTAVELIRGPA